MVPKRVVIHSHGMVKSLGRDGHRIPGLCGVWEDVLDALRQSVTEETRVEWISPARKAFVVTPYWHLISRCQSGVLAPRLTKAWKKCVRKTNSGCVYPTEELANLDARATNLHILEGKVRAYRCLCCRKWHIGNPENWDAWH